MSSLLTLPGLGGKQNLRHLTTHLAVEIRRDRTLQLCPTKSCKISEVHFDQNDPKRHLPTLYAGLDDHMVNTDNNTAVPQNTGPFASHWQAVVDQENESCGRQAFYNRTATTDLLTNPETEKEVHLRNRLLD